MKARVVLSCPECGCTREVSGEIPEEYTDSFLEAVHREGWVPRPGADNALICGQCLLEYVGHETMDDEDKVQGLRNPKET